MTDLEKFVDLYKSFGIEVGVNTNKEYINPKYDIVVLEVDDKNFDGYPSFCSVIKFDKNGKFVIQGFWE
jgi:hypothetical protein